MSKPVVRMWLAEPPPPEVKEALRRLERLDDLVRLAVMPDVHLGERVCIGCVLATTELIYPAAIGGDIGCGIASVALQPGEPLSRLRAEEVLRALGELVPVMRHRSLAASPWLADDVDPAALSSAELAGVARREGRVEAGTLGRGNHFLEVQVDDEGRLWLMVHSGSRVMGQAITRHHLSLARRGRGLEFLSAAEECGRAYLNDLEWAVRYARLSRRLMLGAAGAVMREVAGMGVDWDSYLDTDHNHVRSEEHFGRRLWVHRKGASPAAEGEPGLIPGCMGGESFHVVGRGCEEALRSSSHGAGRAMSRAEARRRVGAWQLRAGAARSLVFDVRLSDALREEAPPAYKDIRVVMRAQRELVKIRRSVRGLITYKGV